MGLEIDKHVSNGITTLRLTGELDTATASQLESIVEDVLANEEPRIIFDMGGISYVSSVGLAVIVYTSKAMRAHDDRFAMHSIQQDVMEVLSVSGLDQQVTVAESQNAAVALMSK